MTPLTTTPTAPATLALVGHPNVGKSVIFNELTGKYVTVSNFPGTTVDISRGQGTASDRTWTVFDSPGVVSLQPKTEDERVTRDLLVEARPDVVVQVADAKNLAKGLHLTLELAEFGIPQILVLNMSDEAADRGIRIDVARLSTLLGIPVVETTAITGDGIPALKAAIGRAARPTLAPRYDKSFIQSLEKIEGLLDPASASRRAIAVSLFTRDKSALEKAVRFTAPGRIGELEATLQAERARFQRSPEVLIFEGKQLVVQELTGEVLARQTKPGTSWLATLGNWSMRPWPGYLFAALTLFALYEFVGVFGADFLVGTLEETVFGEHLNPGATALIQRLAVPAWIQDALVGPYGIITMALTYAFALILPIVTTFFLFFGFLEDSGYLPRLAVMMDRFFRMMGLNGRAVLPMVLGLGCDTMATVTTRILDTRKEKLIMSLLLTLSVPCSAQLGAILGMAAGVSWRVLAIWLGVVAGTMMLTGWVAARVLPGSRAPFLVEIPPLRMPKLSNIYKKVRARLKWYLKEVIPLFVLATLILFTLDRIHVLQVLQRGAEPLVVTFLGLPAQATQAFLIGFFRRDYGAAGFFELANSGQMTAHQVTVSIVVITLFMPCIAHLLMTVKERGAKAAAIITAFVLSFSLLVGGALNALLRFVPVR